MNARILALALTATALALAGCGGSGDSGSASTGGAAEPQSPALTKSELVKQADAICKDMQDQLKAVATPESLSELASAVGKQVDISAPALKKLRSLTPPANLADSYESWTEKLALMNEQSKKIRDAAKSGSESKVNDVMPEMEKINSEATGLGKQLGFKACA